MRGEIWYNEKKVVEEIEPQKMCAYISQYDLHIPEMTVRETLDFATRCQGIGSRAGNNNLFRLSSDAIFLSYIYFILI